MNKGNYSEAVDQFQQAMKKYKRANSYAGVVINLFLVPNFLVSYFFYYHTKILSMNILIYLIIYITSYIILNKKL